MGNREQRGNKEKRKPKANKPKAPAQTSTFASSPTPSKTGKTGR